MSKMTFLDFEEKNMGEKILQGFRLKISQNGLLFSLNDQNVIFKCHGVKKIFSAELKTKYVIPSKN